MCSGPVLIDRRLDHTRIKILLSITSLTQIFFICGFEGAITTFSHSGVDYREAIPVPIPNTEVKLPCADDTWRETARKNR
jgi:hypothetical protein